jgi:hypothetical protein
MAAYRQFRDADERIFAELRQASFDLARTSVQVPSSVEVFLVSRHHAPDLGGLIEVETGYRRPAPRVSEPPSADTIAAHRSMNPLPVCNENTFGIELTAITSRFS